MCLLTWRREGSKSQEEMETLFVDDPRPTMCVILDSSWSHYQPALMMDASFYIRRMEPKRVSNVQNYIGSLLIMYSWAWEKKIRALCAYVHTTNILFYNLLKQWVIYFLEPVKQNSNVKSKFKKYLHHLTNHSPRRLITAVLSEQ